MKRNTFWPGRGRPAARWRRRRPALDKERHPGRMGWLAPAAGIGAALIVAACGSSPTGSGRAASAPSSASPGVASSSRALKTRTARVQLPRFAV
jgi:hypothetical protein